MLSTHLPLLSKLRRSEAIQLLPFHILMDWTQQSFSTVILLMNSWATLEIVIFSFPQQEMLFTCTLCQTYMKKSDCLYMKQRHFPVFFLPSSWPWSALSSLSSASLSLSTLLPSLCLFPVYSSLLLFSEFPAALHP
jgi:hypothetical protein